MFLENELRGRIADTLAEEAIALDVPLPEPLSCDRWLARSALHKAIRRGDYHLALRALATLIHEQPSAIWRALTIIAMEDVGVSGIDAFVAAVIAGRDRRWRERVGGDWKVGASVVRRMCLAVHDQAVCDLFDSGRGRPGFAAVRSVVLEEDLDELAHRLRGGKGRLVEQAIIVQAIGGGLADGQRHRDPFAVFDLLADREHCWEVIDLCRAAWRLTRCELAFLLPLIWAAWRTSTSYRVADDPFPPIAYVGDVPGYAVDQFTRSGIQVARRLLAADPALREILDQARVPRATQHRTVGDLLFQVEGGLLSRRALWEVGEELRLPYRCLADTIILGSLLHEAIDRVTTQGALIASLRGETLSPRRLQKEL